MEKTKRLKVFSAILILMGIIGASIGQFFWIMFMKNVDAGIVAIFFAAIILGAGIGLFFGAQDCEKMEKTLERYKKSNSDLEELLNEYKKSNNKCK